MKSGWPKFVGWSPSSKPADYLVANRLIDMVKTHPQQDNTRICETCRAPVGLYPSSQRALQIHPKMKIICIICVIEKIKKDREGEFLPAGSIEEIRQETLDSKPVKKQ